VIQRVQPIWGGPDLPQGNHQSLARYPATFAAHRERRWFRLLGTKIPPGSLRTREEPGAGHDCRERRDPKTPQGAVPKRFPE
jgi:hypothetical protein